MTMQIEGIYKNGKILPSKEIKLENNTKVLIVILDKFKKKTSSLAGAWKNYKTSDGKDIDWLKKKIYETRKISSRKSTAL